MFGDLAHIRNSYESPGWVLHSCQHSQVKLVVRRCVSILCTANYDANIQHSLGRKHITLCSREVLAEN